MRKRLEKARKQHHFESTERTGNLTLQALFPSLLNELKLNLDCDQITEMLKNPDENLSKQEKRDLWNK